MIVSSTTYYLTLEENYQKSKASYLRLKKLLDIPNENNGSLTIKEHIFEKFNLFLCT